MNELRGSGGGEGTWSPARALLAREAEAGRPTRCPSAPPRPTQRKPWDTAAARRQRAGHGKPSAEAQGRRKLRGEDQPPEVSGSFRPDALESWRTWISVVGRDGSPSTRDHAFSQPGSPTDPEDGGAQSPGRWGLTREEGPLAGGDRADSWGYARARARTGALPSVHARSGPPARMRQKTAPGREHTPGKSRAPSGRLPPASWTAARARGRRRGFLGRRARIGCRKSEGWEPPRRPPSDWPEAGRSVFLEAGRGPAGRARRRGGGGGLE